MGRRLERKRHDNNNQVAVLLKESETRTLIPAEIEIIRQSYTGYGGLYDTFGQFFTPPIVTRFVMNLLGITSGLVLETSCGAGAFLEVLPPACQVEAFELMQEASTVAKLLYPSAKIIRDNTLTHLHELEGRFDFVIGNPPFCDIPKYDDYSGFTIAKKGKNRAEWYFLELGLRALKPGGVMAFVLPDGILSNSKEKILRQWIMEEMAWVRGVFSIPMETFKLTGTTVKTSVLVLQKKIPGVDLGDYPIMMAICEQIGWDSRGRETGKCDLPGILNHWQEMYPNGLPTAEQLIGTETSVSVAVEQEQQEPITVVPHQAAADNHRWGQMAFGF